MSMTIGEFIALHRKKSNFSSQRRFAHKTGISSATISRIETNIQKPNPDTLKKMSKYLRTTSYEELMIRSGYTDKSESIHKNKSNMNEIEKLMLEGWNINIECKGKGRAYEMTFEATMHKVGGDPISNFYTNHHAVGDSLEELVDNLRKTIY